MHCPRTLRTDLIITAALLLLLVILRANIDKCVQQVVPSLINPDFFPSVVLNCLIAINLLILVLDLRQWRRPSLTGPAGEADSDEAGDETGTGGPASLLIYIGILFGYVLGLYWLGFVCATPPVMLAIALMLGLRRVALACVVYVLFAVLMNYLALHVMQIILPVGVLWN